MSIVGVCAAGLTTFSFVPQVVKVYRNKSVKDVSFIMLLQLATGAFLWTLYGIYLKDMIIILANTVTLAIVSVLIFLYFRYRKAAI
jgi:MtN3 and saliva related transmembrane protein